MPQAIIIGAGPAGSVAGIILSRGGFDVAIIEQSRFPRDKVCGECLSAMGMDVLEQLGLGSALKAVANRLDRAIFHPPSGPGMAFELPRPMWGLSRCVLDETLLNAARHTGGRILQPARCEAMEPQVRIRRLESNQLESLESDWILLADGKGALLEARPPATGDLGIKTHFTAVAGPRDAIELFGLEGLYVGSAAIEDGRWNVAMSAPAKRVAAMGGNLERLWQTLLNQNRALRERFAPARRVSNWLASPLPRFAVAARWPHRVIPIGNAAAALEPIGGEGMGLAMHSAWIAAEVLRMGADEEGVERIRREFISLWRLRRFTCRALALVLGRPALAEAMAALVRQNPWLARAMMGAMGKCAGQSAY